jgi:hypothetical protein
MSRVRQMMRANEEQWDTVQALARFGARFAGSTGSDHVREAAATASEAVQACPSSDKGSLLRAIDRAREAASEPIRAEARSLERHESEPVQLESSFMRKMAQTA